MIKKNVFIFRDGIFEFKCDSKLIPDAREIVKSLKTAVDEFINNVNLRHVHHN